MSDSKIQNEEQYNSLLKKGYSHEKAVGLANASQTDQKGGNSKPYNEWTKEELYQEARRVGIQGRSYMSKKNLIQSLRNI
ncbi:Rho termination factor [Flavobacterium sp.]|uniref:Rho termination factor n=1 Tax=Flavobacterium sp. TaxID=239 RepID=UPI00374CBC2E